MKTENATMTFFKEMIEQMLSSINETNETVKGMDMIQTVDGNPNISPVNKLCLSRRAMLKNFHSDEWISSEQAKAQKLYVRKGERSVKIEEWALYIDRRKVDNNDSYTEIIDNADRFLSDTDHKKRAKRNRYTNEEVNILIRNGIIDRSMLSVSMQNVAIFNTDQLVNRDGNSNLDTGKDWEKYKDDVILNYLSSYYQTDITEETEADMIKDLLYRTVVKNPSENNRSNNSQRIQNIKNAISTMIIFDELKLSLNKNIMNDIMHAKDDFLYLKDSGGLGDSTVRDIAKNISYTVSGFNEDSQLFSYKKYSDDLDRFRNKNQDLIEELLKSIDDISLQYQITPYSFVLKLNITDRNTGNVSTIRIDNDYIMNSYGGDIVTALYAYAFNHSLFNSNISEYQSEKLEEIREFCSSRNCFLKLSDRLRGIQGVSSYIAGEGIRLEIPVYSADNNDIDIEDFIEQAQKLQENNIYAIADQKNIMKIEENYIEPVWEDFIKVRNFYVDEMPIFKRTSENIGPYQNREVKTGMNGIENESDAIDYLRDRFRDSKLNKAQYHALEIDIPYTDNPEILIKDIDTVISQLRNENNENLAICTAEKSKESITVLKDMKEYISKKSKNAKRTDDMRIHSNLELSDKYNDVLGISETSESQEDAKRILHEMIDDMKESIRNTCLNLVEYEKANMDVKRMIADREMCISLMRMMSESPARYKALSKIYITQTDLDEHRRNLEDLEKIMKRLKSSTFIEDFKRNILLTSPDNNISDISVRFNDMIHQKAISCIHYDNMLKEPVIDSIMFQNEVENIKQDVMIMIDYEKMQIENINVEFSRNDFVQMLREIINESKGLSERNISDSITELDTHHMT